MLLYIIQPSLPAAIEGLSHEGDFQYLAIHSHFLVWSKNAVASFAYTVMEHNLTNHVTLTCNTKR